MIENLHIPDLLDGGWRSLPFGPFREGVEIHRLYDTGGGGAAAAFLKYAPGAGVPLHRHAGYETIFVLDGSQSDASGLYPKGSTVVNPPGTIHEVSSAEGCVVLIVWEKPVVFVDPDTFSGLPG